MLDPRGLTLKPHDSFFFGPRLEAPGMVPRALRGMFLGAPFRWGVRADTPENGETLPSSRRANEEEGRVSLSLSGCERLVQPGENPSVRAMPEEVSPGSASTVQAFKPISSFRRELRSMPCCSRRRDRLRGPCCRPRGDRKRGIPTCTDRPFRRPCSFRRSSRA